MLYMRPADSGVFLLCRVSAAMAKRFPMNPCSQDSWLRKIVVLRLVCRR